jgi:hypothetical protein
MYAGRTTVEMTAAVFASALAGSRVRLPLEQAGNPFAAR